jgi:hypothetical protein
MEQPTSSEMYGASIYSRLGLQRYEGLLVMTFPSLLESTVGFVSSQLIGMAKLALMLFKSLFFVSFESVVGGLLIVSLIACSFFNF